MTKRIYKKNEISINLDWRVPSPFCKRRIQQLLPLPMPEFVQKVDVAEELKREDGRKHGELTFFGLLRVTLVIPGTLVKPSLAIDLRAFFSLREWTIAPAPAGRPSPASASDSELSDPSSSAVTCFVGSSSGSSSMRGFDMLGVYACCRKISKLTSMYFWIVVVCARPRRALFCFGEKFRPAGYFVSKLETNLNVGSEWVIE